MASVVEDLPRQVDSAISPHPAPSAAPRPQTRVELPSGNPITDDIERLLAIGLGLLSIALISYRGGLFLGLLLWFGFSLVVWCGPAPSAPYRLRRQRADPCAARLGLLPDEDGAARSIDLVVPPRRMITLDSPLRARRAVVLSVRNPDHHPEIADRLVGGETALFYVGQFGVIFGVTPDYLGRVEGRRFWELKKGRPVTAKVPVFVVPRDAVKMIDFDFVHPALRHLRNREEFERLWTNMGGPLHVICPLRQPLPFLPSAFQTTPEDLARQADADPALADRLVPCTTASFCYFADPRWADLFELLRQRSHPRQFFGGSSFNDHGEEPAYSYDELLEYVTRRQDIEFDFVIRDELYEASGAFGSHSQVRLPLPQEEPALVMLRQGAADPEWIAAATGYPVRPLASMAIGSRPFATTDHELRQGLRRMVAWTAD